MNRMDILGDTKRERLTTLQGDVLGRSMDEALQGIVCDAAAATDAPIALVSLVLDHIQFFRAHVGLPPDLALTRSTDRDASFCQLVVHSEQPLEVGAADGDERVPQQLVKDYGIKAYLGFPVRVEGHVVGSLCVIDVKERAFTDEDRHSLLSLASRASARLDELARSPTVSPPAASLRSTTARAAEPLFGELRNALGPLRVHVGLARASLTEIDALRSLAQLIVIDPEGARRNAAVLMGAHAAFSDLAESFTAIEEVSTRVDDGVLALEALHVPMSHPAPLAKIIRAAEQLAFHRTKLVGGVTWAGPGEVKIAAPSTMAVALLANALRDVPRPIAPRVVTGADGWLRIRFRDPEAMAHVTESVRGADAYVECDGDDLVVTLRIFV